MREGYSTTGVEDKVRISLGGEVGKKMPCWKSYTNSCKRVKIGVGMEGDTEVEELNFNSE